MPLPAVETLQTALDTPRLADVLIQWLECEHTSAQKEDASALCSALASGVLNSQRFDETVDTVVDVLWMQSFYHSNTRSDNNSSNHETILGILKELLHQASDAATDESGMTKLVSLHDKLLAQLDGLLLEASGWTAAAATLGKKVRLYNTQTFYKQFKFNLLAETSEGYAKYLQLLRNNSSSSAPETLIQDSQLIIGTFSLDPNRCIDLIVTCMTAANGDEIAALIKFLQSFPLDHLPEILAFQLSTVISNKTALFQTMVRLVQHDLLQVSTMLDWCGPFVLHETYTLMESIQRKRVQAMGRVQLNSSSNNAVVEEPDLNASNQLEQFQNCNAVQFLLAFFHPDNNNASTLLMEAKNALDDDEWSQLCFLLPDTLGLAIGEVVSDAIQSFVDKAPWKATTTTGLGNNDMETTETQTLHAIIASISKPLQWIMDAGCIQTVLYTQLCRMMAALLEQEEGQDVSESVLTFIESFLLPSLSLFQSNPMVAHEVWRVLEHFPYQVRYRFYRSWRGTGLERASLRSDKPLWLIESELQAGKNIRYTLKRLSKDTIRDASRSIAKVCHSHPLVVFTTILNQIESYDNLVEVMVDALRFVTPLSLDVLSHCILFRLAENSADGTNRSRLKEDGLNVSQWLQSLEAFVGYFYKRFPFVDFQGILSYLTNRLKDGHVMELGVLRTLLKTSGGYAFADYAPAASLSMSQLEGRSGSTLLKRETISFGIVETINRRASHEVRRVLQNDNVGVCLSILLAQVRNHIVFGDKSGKHKPVKLVANLVDMCQALMTILLDFMSHSTDDEFGMKEKSTIVMYGSSLPTLADLHTVYGVDVASSWMLCRPLIRSASLAAQEGDSNDKENLLASFTSSPEWHSTYKQMLAPTTWNFLTTDLFEAFFAHSSYDIFCPENSYATEIARLEKESERLAQSKTPVQQSIQPGAPPPRNEQEEKERVKNTAEKLIKDLSKQKTHVETVRNLIKDKCERFFQSVEVSAEAASMFLSRCIYPRCMQGPDDALYCARFVSLLHQEGTPGFGTLHLFDTMIVALSRALFGLTEGEAANVSILLLETWKIVSRWRYDEKAFTSEVVNKPGSFMRSSSSEEPCPISFKEYEELYNKWHAAIGAAAIGCLKSSEYIHTRNCLIVLTRMVEAFPTRPGLANRLIKALEPLQDDSNTLADIRASAQAYNMQLVRARDDGVWKEESAATVLARQQKSELAAVARQQQAEKQMQEIVRESEKITEEIGVRDRRGGRNDRNFRSPVDDIKRPNFEPPPGRVLPGPSIRVPSGDVRDRDRAPERAPPVRSEFATMAVGLQRQDAPVQDFSDRGRGEPPSARAGSKRSRLDEPEEGESTGRDDARETKRARTDGDGRRRGGRR
jgi:THO complex subunit 2